MSQPGSPVLTKSEYARLHGVKPHAVSMWIARGHLTPPALRADEQIDVALADEQLRDRLDALKSTGKGVGPQNLFEGAAATSATAAGDGKVEDASLLALRRRRLLIDIEEKEQQHAVTRGELMPATEIAAIWARELDELVQAVEQWLPDLVVKLGGGRAEVDIARQDWRALRRRLAEAAEAAAQPDEGRRAA